MSGQARRKTNKAEAGAVRQQRRVPGRTRFPRHAGLLPKIDAAVKQTAERFGVTPSWVVADILAAFFGIEEQERFEEPWKLRATAMTMRRRRK